MAIELVPQACPAAGRGAPPVYQMEFICRTSSDFFGELSGYRLRRARPGLFAIEHQGGLLSPPTRLGGVAVSMGLRPRLSAAAAFAALLEPRAGARGLSFNSPVSRQCCGLGESGEAAVSPGQPRKLVLQAFLLERRSRGRMSPSGRFWRNSAEVTFNREGGVLMAAVA